MKKVRFESPVKPIFISTMHESECHSPRPFIQKQINSAPRVEYLDYRPVTFTNDPVQRFECSNSSPYPAASRTSLTDTAMSGPRWEPSNELDLSILDSAITARTRTQQPFFTDNKIYKQPMSNCKTQLQVDKKIDVLSPLENITTHNPPNVLRKNDDFFLRRDNLNGYKKLSSDMNELKLDKENNPLLMKTQIMMMGQPSVPIRNNSLSSSSLSDSTENSPCRCHHCVKVSNSQQSRVEIVKNQNINSNSYNVCHCIAMLPQSYTHCPCNGQPMRPCAQNCNCNNTRKAPPAPLPENLVDKKTWALQKYAQNTNTECLDVEKQTNITLNEKEPTVADLFNIIKMQNEQLQLLQEKVDKFISNSNQGRIMSNPAVQKYVTQQVAPESGRADQKISIGVMTSFELVRTSTIINQKFVKQNEAQIQCNRSQISIQEVVSKQPPNLNFLDGLAPMSKHVDLNQQSKSNCVAVNCDLPNNDCNNEKTFNETSLYNVQVDNAITPNISPEQSLYLDIRDYSDSDASSDDQSNVGWTYYNKVMTHVNGMLQEGDMPSSASALYRNVRQKCLQMQVDKSNVSVAKRVTFGDDIHVIQKPNFVQQTSSPTTDTSLKMKQLAAKYLKNGAVMTGIPPPVTVPVDMSLATRNYMEKHRILNGVNMQPVQHHLDIPKFLDITALKQQPKFL